MDFEIDGDIKTMYVQGISDDGLLWLKDVNDLSRYYDVKQLKWLY